VKKTVPAPVPAPTPVEVVVPVVETPASTEVIETPTTDSNPQ